MPCITKFKPDILDVIGNHIQFNSWEYIFERFSKPELSNNKKLVSSWSPAIFEGDSRSKGSRILTLSAIVIDYDKGVTSFEEAVEYWSRFKSFLHTSFSHTDSIHRFRVILPTSQAMVLEEFKELISKVYDFAIRCGHVIDKQCKNPQRIWFEPCCTKLESFRFHKSDGNYVDQDFGKFMSAYGDVKLTRACERINSASKGEKHDTLLKEAYGVAGFVAGGEIDQEKAWTELLEAAELAGFDNSEAERVIRGAFESGMEKPLKAPNTFELVDQDTLFSEPGATQYLAEGIIVKSSVSLLAGYGQSYKTFAATDLMIALAVGGKWMGKYKCTKGRSILLDYESGQYEFRRRLNKLIGGAQVSPSKGMIELCTMPRAYLNAPDFEQQITPIASQFDLVVIDSLKASTPGADENSSDIRVNIDKLKRVAERTGSAFLIIHHARKTSGDKFGGTPDPRQILRGSSAIFDAVDTCLTMTLNNDKKISLAQVKSRLGPAIEPQVITVTDTEDNRGLIIQADDVKPNDVSDPLTDAIQILLTFIRRYPGETERTLCVRSGFATKRVQVALEKLVEANEIRTYVEDERVAYFIK